MGTRKMKSKLPYIVNKNLQVEICTIGYKAIGESIVLFVKVDSNIVFSAVIDSYCYNGVNKTIEILKNNNVETIDYFCWTHPDDDHSKGLDELFNDFIDENTLINIPENAEINSEKCSDSTIDIFNMLKANLGKRGAKSGKRYKVYTVSDFKELLANEDDLEILYNEKQYCLEIKSIAPNSQLIRDDFLLDRFCKNKHSIAFIIYFGNNVFLFTGDIENPTIKQFKRKNIPSSLSYLKIPHHGSKGSDSLLEYIDYIDVSCVTSYVRGSSRNPEKEVLDRYQEVSKKVYSSYNIEGENNDDFGIIYTTFDILNELHTTKLEGNACLL